MIISIDVDKAFDKNLIPFRKMFSYTRNRKKLPQTDKGHL